MKAAITATAKYTPPDKLTNFDLEKILDTNDEWIRTRTGIQERRILKDPDKATAYMCAEVSKQILEKRGISAEEIDLIIIGTVTPDTIFPAAGCLVQGMIGAKNAWAFDLSAACSGFLYSLVVGSQFIESGMHKKVLVLGADKMSAITDFTDRNTAVLFGDGAGGVLLEPAKDGYGVLDAKLYADGANGKDHLYMLAGGSLRPPSHETVDKKMHAIRQDGRVVFKSAVTEMANSAVEMMRRNNLSADDITYLIPHQANHRIIMATAERMNISMDKVGINIDRYGNTTAATIPLCLAELDESGKLKSGDNLIFVSFGAGYTWGGIYVKWQ
ncbi:3-oxoacyl-(acyl-carrier-protein) synthase III [Chloroherpeton thalassium ATCC 35110]|uniref:Beta-ketoacyl-[acyl-carrier-protein] synthase III n=1 Tax=Chloroherpeton thalassium (strain ATCC 35110 / GB-78) TaxID=517418 RepID=B3QVT8_CHLT3|nr:beta-ketoacyl-ACP synthase III [Chloroherpeton thalassium]ACF13145.1 3-oxoacyl-(acyl-carrier-protein) synthase III [Chloroherpeton thalassium ATCC 35110]